MIKKTSVVLNNHYAFQESIYKCLICLADKKSEGRCSRDYFGFTVCERHFSDFIDALDSKGILRTLN